MALFACAGSLPARERPPAPAEYPISGTPRPELAGLDQAMLRFMRERGIRAGTLCVARGGTVVLERGYGWRDASAREPLPADAPMRIASLAKPITAAAIRKLAAAGKLDLGAKVFELLDIEPAGEPDPRLGEITVAHLLEHRGGWDREKSGDPMFMARQIATDLGVRPPPRREQFAAWVAGRPLDFEPGARVAYSNFGYLLLGLLIEKATGAGATAWVAENVMGGSDDFGLARSLPRDRDPREPHYHDPGPDLPSVFGGGAVPPPDGSWYSEAMETHGGWRCSARSYVEFLTAYWMGGGPRGSWRGQEWTFRGSLPGTWAVARQRPDGISYTALFNQREDPSGLPYEAIGDLLDKAIDAVGGWPE